MNVHLPLAALIAALIFTQAPSADPDRIRGHLESHGYRAVSLTGHPHGLCGSPGDEFPFRAIAPTGAHVHGSVCKGLIFYEINQMLDR